MSSQTGTWAARERVGPIRAAADATHRVLATALLPVIAVQFALAGLGAFRGSAGYGPHELLGTIIGAASLVLLVAALVARAGRTPLLLSAALFVLAGPVQPLLAMLGWQSGAWFGALHAFSGIAIFALTGWLGADARRRHRGEA